MLYMKEWMDSGEHQGLSHLCFKVIHFPGHGNQNILVKQKRSKPEVLNIVPHYFFRGFSKTTVHQRAGGGWIYLTWRESIKLAVVIQNPDSNLGHSLVTQSPQNGGTSQEVLKMSTCNGPFGGPRKVWLSSSWDICDNVSFTSYPKFLNTTLASSVWH